MNIHTEKDALIEIADRINQKRRMEVIETFKTGQGLYEEFKRMKDHGVYEKGNKTKTMRLIALIPPEIDRFFTDIYGKDYYKDKSFFKTRHPEWTVVEPSKI